MNDEILNFIKDKVEKIAEDVGELKITAVKHDINLETHMEQSRTLKKLYDHLDEEKIQPLQRDFAKLKGAYAVFGGLGILAGIVLAVVEIIKLFHH